MRETRTSGSEGGAAEPNRPFLPLSMRARMARLRWQTGHRALRSARRFGHGPVLTRSYISRIEAGLLQVDSPSHARRPPREAGRSFMA
jgi:hypothetical protein